ncbi:MAG: RidA family protein [Candidatus Longimicrobiales bacterium M2_2A_002]
MDPVRVHSDDAPEAIGPYSQAMKLGDFVFTAGQIALDPDTMEIVGDDVTAQTERVMANLRAILEKAGSGLDAVLKTTVYLADMDDFAAMNEVYGAHFGDHRPARSTVAVRTLPRNVRVEIDAIAFAG